MLEKIIHAIFKKEPIRIDVGIKHSESLLKVYLKVNGRQCAWIQCVIQSENSILIGDILHCNGNTDYNKGYGSRMMNELLDYAKEHNFKYVYGNLSVVDKPHKDRLHHFYRKFGFIINEYSELHSNYYGKIELDLLRQE